MSITPQGEQYGLFDGQRTAQRDLPLPGGLGDMLRGPSITPGMLNPRGAARLEDIPDSAYGGSAPQFGDFGQDGYDYEGMSRREFDDRMRAMDSPEAHEAFDEQLRADEDSGYNWGPPPGEEYHRFAQRR